MNRARCLWLLGCLLPLVACETKPAATAAGPATAPAASPPPAPDSSRAITFTWQDEACTNTGTYAAGAYTQQQLRATYQLVNGSLLLADVTPFRLADYTDAHFTKAATLLRHERDSAAALLQGLNVVPTPFWRRIKHLRELELAEYFAWQQAAIEGYFHPETWLRNRYFAACPEYARALASTDTAVVIRAWRRLIDEQKKNNGYPENLEATFQVQSASAERLAYGKLTLMTFGWGNCANAQRKYNNLPDQYHLYERFTQLFTHIEQSDCEDVD